jgi:hypothetical protein
LIQLSNFSALSSPLYNSKSNFTSNFSKGKLESFFPGCFLYGIEEELEFEGEDGNGRVSRGSSPSLSPLP